jgi:hypothetical protein
MKATSRPDVPAEVNWDVTYACPLRCTHCYSESGRRPARQLDTDTMMKVADAIGEMRPGRVALTGGEPLAVPGLIHVAARIRRAGIPVSLYTSGWNLTQSNVDDVTRVFNQVTVSVDGATPVVHDRIRGRVGSFDRAMRALANLDAAAQRAVEQGREPTPFGIACTVLRSALDGLEGFCTQIAPRFARLGFVSFAAAMPIGLASRPSFVAQELLTDEQVARMTDPALLARLRRLAPASVTVSIEDSRAMLKDPAGPAGAYPEPNMQVEPDGSVRGFPIYEGTVGSLLEEPGSVLWRRSRQRWQHPFVSRSLRGVKTMREWAEAARDIDMYFAAAKDRARITRRAPYQAAR